MITLSELCSGSTARIGEAIKERLAAPHDHTYLSLGDIAMLPNESWPTKNAWDVADSILFSRGLDYQTKCRIAHILTKSLRECVYWMDTTLEAKYITREAQMSLRSVTNGLACFLSDDLKDNRRMSIGSISAQIKGVICLHDDDAIKQALKQDELERLHIIRVFPPFHLA